MHLLWNTSHTDIKVNWRGWEYSISLEGLKSILLLHPRVLQGSILTFRKLFLLLLLSHHTAPHYQDETAINKLWLGSLALPTRIFKKPLFANWMFFFCCIEKKTQNNYVCPTPNTVQMFYRANINPTRAIFCPSVDHEQWTGQTCRWSAEQLLCFVLCPHGSVFDLFQGLDRGRLQPPYFNEHWSC